MLPVKTSEVENLLFKDQSRYPSFSELNLKFAARLSVIGKPYEEDFSLNTKSFRVMCETPKPLLSGICFYYKPIQYRKKMWLRINNFK